MTSSPAEKLANQSDSVSNEVQIIPLNSIPALHSITQNGEVIQIGEVRDFQWHDALKAFLPSSNMVSFSWAHLKPGERQLPHEHPMQSMVIVVKGSARLLGQKDQIVKEGDVILIPPFCSHGFEGCGDIGVYGFSIQFEEGIYTNPEKARIQFLNK